MSPKSNGSGNVKHGPEEVEKTEEKKQAFEEGDVVALTPSALRIGRIQGMTPRLLYTIGQPNEFMVLHVFETEADGLCLALFPCCLRFVDRDRNGQVRCKGHPAVYFEKVDKRRIPKKGDKSSSVHLPFLPFEVAGLHYEEDEENPRLTLNLFGKRVDTTGPLSKFLKKLAEENKIL
jgi:hypothetical protein